MVWQSLISHNLNYGLIIRLSPTKIGSYSSDDKLPRYATIRLISKTLIWSKSTIDGDFKPAIPAENRGYKSGEAFAHS